MSLQQYIHKVSLNWSTMETFNRILDFLVEYDIMLVVYPPGKSRISSYLCLFEYLNPKLFIISFISCECSENNILSIVYRLQVNSYKVTFTLRSSSPLHGYQLSPGRCALDPSSRWTHLFLWQPPATINEAIFNISCPSVIYCFLTPTYLILPSRKNWKY